jgi:hypothetical protein
MGWREPPYSHFCDRIGRCRATRYTSLGSNSDPKHRTANTGTFSRYFSEIQESIVNTWRITPDVVAQYRDIASFRATRHNMWIQVCRDPGKEWLQLRYCITEDDIEMEMRDWHDDWRIPVLTQEVPKGTEVDTVVHPKSRRSWGNPVRSRCNRRRGVRRRRIHRQHKRTLPQDRKNKERGTLQHKKTPWTSIPQETGPPKRPIIHTGGSCKKEKVHKQLPEYTIMEDDADLMAERVQDHATKDFEEAQHQRGKIQDDLAGIKQVLE